MSQFDDIDEKLRSFLGKRLRGIFRFSPVKRAARKLYNSCAVCGSTQDIEHDHEPPVSPVDREVGSLEYFMRMFCLDENGNVDLNRMQGLCSKHHAEKTAEQIRARAFHKTGPFSARSKQKSLEKKRKKAAARSRPRKRSKKRKSKK